MCRMFYHGHGIYLLLAVSDIDTVSDVYRSPSHALIPPRVHLEHAWKQRKMWKDVKRCAVRRKKYYDT